MQGVASACGTPTKPSPVLPEKWIIPTSNHPKSSKMCDLNYILNILHYELGFTMLYHSLTVHRYQSLGSHQKSQPGQYRKARNSCLSHACVLKICFPPSKCNFQEVMPMSCPQPKSPSKCSGNLCFILIN